MSSDWAVCTGNRPRFNHLIAKLSVGFLPVDLKHIFITDSSSGIYNSTLLCPVGETLQYFPHPWGGDRLVVLTGVSPGTQHCHAQNQELLGNSGSRISTVSGLFLSVPPLRMALSFVIGVVWEQDLMHSRLT